MLIPKVARFKRLKSWGQGEETRNTRGVLGRGMNLVLRSKRIGEATMGREARRTPIEEVQEVQLESLGG